MTRETAATVATEAAARYELGTELMPTLRTTIPSKCNTYWIEVNDLINFWTLS